MSDDIRIRAIGDGLLIGYIGDNATVTGQRRPATDAWDVYDEHNRHTAIDGEQRARRLMDEQLIHARARQRRVAAVRVFHG